MSYNEDFDADFGGYEASGTWIDTDGYSAAGCVQLDGEGLESVSHFENVGIGAGHSLYFGYKVFPGNGNPGDHMLYVEIGINDIPMITEYIGDLPTSADWQLYQADLSAYEGADLTSVVVTAQPASVFPALATNYIYVDSFRLDTSPPPAPGTLNFGLTHSAGGIPGAIAT